MKVSYDGTDYEFSMDDLDVAQATTIKRKYQFSLLSLEDGLKEGDVDALRCVYWLMLAQNGVRQNIDNVNFKVVPFINALQKATADEAAARADTDEESPKES
jgi:hypothetical protein